jgi:two-component system, chemotaxis family, sensor kinase CheA
MVDLSKYETIFTRESRKYFCELDTLLAAAEGNPEDRDIWREIQGKVHSIKGMATALGYRTAGDLSCGIENWCREFQQRRPGPEAVQRLQDGLDVLKGITAAKNAVDKSGLAERFRDVLALFSAPPETTDTTREEDSLPPQSANASVDSINQVRVDYGLIEELVGLSQEILSLEKMLPSNSRKQLPAPARNWVSHYASLLKVLYFKLMNLRLVSVGDFACMFSRLIRDQAIEYGKAVTFEVLGEDIQADIALLDRLREPMVHLIRNAVAHGIEPAEKRVLAGKDPRGLLFLEAVRRRDTLLITLGDDGRGIDRVAVIDYLRRVRGLEPAQIEAMPDRELLSTICCSGYSTVSKPTAIAGQGIGMDVVVRSVESLGGSLFIQSDPGKGARFTIELPVTLSFLYAVTFKLGDFTLSIPTSSVDSVEKLKSQPSCEPPCSYLDLRAVLGVEAVSGPSYLLKFRGGGAAASNGDFIPVVIDTDSIVNKTLVMIPAGELLSKAGVFSGVGVGEDGTVSVILDVEALNRRSGFPSSGASRRSG